MDDFSINLIKNLKSEALDCRKWIVKAAFDPGTHIGGSLSAIDILVALYLHLLKIDSKNPDWENRDRFIMSKGHVAFALYIVLAKKGLISFDDLKQYDKIGNYLSTHPSRKLSGVDFSTGSLGHGLSAGVGMAIISKRENKNFKVYVMLGDGEMQEGSNYEAAMSASKFELDNLIMILDRNKLQGTPTEDVMPIEPIEEKWKAFGWATKTIDGHNMEQIVKTLSSIPLEKNKPTAIIANTVKGKGISFIENTARSHVLQFTKKEMDDALAELGGNQ